MVKPVGVCGELAPVIIDHELTMLPLWLNGSWLLFDGATGACFSTVYWLVVPIQLLDMKIFVDTDSDIRLVRRLRRDISERGRDIEGVIKQYNKFVKPAFDQYIQPTMRLADIVVPRGEPAGPCLPAARAEGPPSFLLVTLSLPFQGVGTQ